MGLAVAIAIAMLVASAAVFAGSDPGKELEQKYGVVSDAAMVSLVGGVVANVARAAKMRNYDCKILGAKELNAFALPDGRVYITEGMVNALDRNPDSIAFVLGHEITHVVQRHSSSQTTGNLLGMAFGWIFAELLGVKSDAARENYIGLGGELVGAKYSRNDEYKADEGGFKLAVAAGYSPQGGPTAMRLLLQKYGKGGAGLPVVGWFASHPDTKNRLAKLDKLAGAAMVAGGGTTTTARSLAGGPTITPAGTARPQGYIPDLRIAVIRSDIHGDAPSPWELNDRVRLAVEGNLQRAGIPVVGRGSSLEATRREKDMPDADPRTQPNKKGVWVATANLELDTFVEKKATRLGMTVSWSDYGLQVGDLVDVKVKMNGKFICIETSEIRPVVAVVSQRRRIDQLTVWLPRPQAGVYLDVRGQVEEMVRSACDECADNLVRDILRVAGQIPSQSGPGLTPVVRTAPTIITPAPATNGSASGKVIALSPARNYFIRVRNSERDRSPVAIMEEYSDHMETLWDKGVNWLDSDRTLSITPKAAAQILKRLGCKVSLDGETQ